MLSSLFTSMVNDLAPIEEEEEGAAIRGLLRWLEKAALEPQAAHQKVLLDLALLLSCLVSRRTELSRSGLHVVPSDLQTSILLLFFN